MISTDLQSLSDWVITWGRRGESMPPDSAAHLASVLLDLSRQVARLERLPVDDAHLTFHGGEIDDSV